MCLLRVGDDRIEEVDRFWILTEGLVEEDAKRRNRAPPDRDEPEMKGESSALVFRTSNILFVYVIKKYICVHT